MGSGKGGGGSKTEETVVPKSMQTTLPNWVQGPLQNQYGNVGGMSPNVPYNPYMTQAAQGGINQAYDTSGVIDPARQQWQSAIQGPQGDQMSAEVIGQASQPFIDQFMPQLTSNYAQAGRTGSGMHNYAAGQGIANIVAQQYQQNADREQRGYDRQQNAIGMAPQMQALQMSPYSTAYDYGSMLRDEGLQARDAQYGQLSQLGNIAALMRGQDMENTVVTKSGGGGGGFNPLGAIGGGLTGFAMGGPVGAAGGAVSGGWG